MKKNKLFKINIFMFILFFIMLLTLEIDYLTYLFSLKYLLSFSISLILNVILFVFIFKKIEMKIGVQKEDLIFFLILLSIFLITIIFPDRTFDTFNYHLYLQENPFGDKINYDFFSGKNLNSFTYAFADRMFYIFRYFLGYRLGVILNYLIIIVIYMQIKEILKNIIVDAKNITIVIFSSLIATSLSLIDIVDSYYIDLISLVLLLEIFRLIFTQKIDDKNNSFLLGYLALLFGLSFTVKISNSIVLILFFILYILRNKNIKKYINLKNILITLILLIIPFFVYVLYAFISTGNPVFPFYNTIFKSKYFGNWNWLDKRFGPRNITQVFIYPLIMFFNKNLTCDIAIIEPIWSMGYFVSIFYIMYYSYIKIIKKESINKERLFISIVTFIIYILWSDFQLGYTRYGFITLILGSIITYVFIYDLYKNKKIILLSFMIVSILYNFSYNAANYMYLNKDWIYNNIFNNYGNYKYNIKNLFSKGDEKTINFEENSVWGIIYNNSGYAQMINPNIPIININDSADNEYTKKLLSEKLDNASHIYSLVDSLDLDNFIKRLNDANYEIINVRDVITTNIIGKSESLTYIFEIKENKNYNYKNIVENFETIKEIDTSNINNISFYIGINRWFNNKYKQDLDVQIIGINNDSQVNINNIKISKDGMMNNVNLDVSNYEKIKIYSQDSQLMIISNELN